MSYSEILYETDGPLLCLTMNRPEKLNAFTGTMLEEFIDAYERADADDQSIRMKLLRQALRYRAGL